MAAWKNASARVGRATTAGVQGLLMAFETRLGSPPAHQTDLLTRFQQVQAAILLPFLAVGGFIVVQVLHEVFAEILFGALSAPLSGFLSPALGIAMFLGMVFALYKWVVTGGFGLFG